MRLRVSEIMKVAMKHPGMWDDFLKAGALDDTKQYLEIERGRFDGINRQYFDGGLGTLLHEVLAPAAKFADLVLGTDLQNCGGCGERELKLNDITEANEGNKG